MATVFAAAPDKSEREDKLRDITCCRVRELERELSRPQAVRSESDGYHPVRDAILAGILPTQRVDATCARKEAVDVSQCVDDCFDKPSSIGIRVCLLIFGLPAVVSSNFIWR